jgi:inhibitor of KinA
LELTFNPLGDTGLQIVFGTEISEETIRKIQQFVFYLEEHPVHGIVEWVPAYVTLTIYYLPELILYQDLCDQLHNISTKLLKNKTSPTSYVYEIPTLYGGEAGIDLSYVATVNGLTENEVISIHSRQDYLIYMLGFAPGFPYLGGVSKKIATPRRENPRLKVKAGSVGIAGEQTGIYPLESPGGWQIIGRTPLKLYDPNRENAILMSAGHYLRFVSINEKEYLEIERAVQLGKYEVTRFTKKGGSL